MKTFQVITARRRIRAEMQLLGLQSKELARKLGYRKGFLDNVIAGETDSGPARRKIEKFFRIKFWADSSPLAQTSTQTLKELTPCQK